MRFTKTQLSPQAGTTRAGQDDSSAHTSTGQSSQTAPSGPRLSTKRVDMVGSYLTSVTSSNVTCVDDNNYFDTGTTRMAVPTRPSLGHRPPTLAKTMSSASLDTSGLHVMSSESLDPSDTSTTAIPGLSIVTWEEFVEEPCLLHNLFSKDKDDFIQFDCNIVNNFFHDSRMDPPLLGGPSGDGLSWTIFVDSYTQLRDVREAMTTRISVLLVDLVKPNNQGSASCLVAINPMDDHIRRVLHLTMSRAMETVFADRSFSVEIDLNDNVRQWCQAVLQIECQVNGGRVVVTNGDPVESFCLVDNPAFCVLAFPVWLYRRIRYLTHRKRNYDDTLVQFEGATFVLCTRSDKLRKYSEAMQLSSGKRLIQKNTSAVTTATQTLNASTPSLNSDLSIQEMDEASDNDVMKRREATSDLHETYASQCYPNPSLRSNDDDTDVTNHKRDRVKSSTKVSFGHVNEAFIKEEAVVSDPAIKFGRYEKESAESPSVPKMSRGNIQDEQFDYEEDILNAVTRDNLAKAHLEITNNTENNETTKSVKYKSSGEKEEEIPTPRSEFLLRPDTPFRPTPKERKSKARDDDDSPISSPASKDTDLSSKPPDINDKIFKRQKKISSLLKDLVSFKTPSYNLPSDPDDDVRGDDNGIETKVSSPRYRKNNFFSPASKSPVKPPRKPVQTQVNNLDPSGTPSVFPYTSDLLNFPAMATNEDVDNLEKFGARLKKNGSDKKKPAKRTEDMLFMPRLNLEEIDPDRNCFSDQDIADSDVTDLENEFEQEGAVSDTEGYLSSRLIPVYSTERTLSIDSVYNNATNKKNVFASKNNELDSDLEITDCEVDEQASPRKMNSPRILPGAMAAHQLRASSANARSRDYIPPNVQANRRGGNQNDSRRRYLALNSLRRKAYKLALQSQVRSQKRPSSAELVSYNCNSRPASANASVAIMSKV